MSFTPILPMSGLSGWGFLKLTKTRQQALHQSLPAHQRDEAYFRDRIGKADTAEKLVNDPRLLRIALTAFGLEGDVKSKAFIQKILEGGTLKEGSLANKLADKRYQKLAAAFGYGDYSVPRTRISTFPTEILEQFHARSFETAVGRQNNTYRLALNAEREVPILAGGSMSDMAKWYTLLGNAPLREVMLTALGLPKSFSSIDLDQQVGVFKARTEAIFGSPELTQFTDVSKLETLTRRFLLQSEAQGKASENAPSRLMLALFPSQI